MDISQARMALRERAEWTRERAEWKRENIDSLPDISILAESVTKDPLVEETMWRERWELWSHELDQKAAAKYDAYITDIRSRKSRVEWEMRDRKSELEIREDDIKRLRDLVKSWDRMKKAA